MSTNTGMNSYLQKNISSFLEVKNKIENKLINIIIHLYKYICKSGTTEYSYKLEYYSFLNYKEKVYLWYMIKMLT